MAFTVAYPDGPIGAEISGIDLSADSADADFARITDVLYARGVMVISGQHLDEAAHVRFARRFGTLQKILFSEHLVRGYPELFVVSNIVENGRPIGNTDAGRWWHTDGAYLPEPHKVSMLHAIEVPVRAGKPLGDTLFAGMAAAYAALPEAMKRRIDGLRGVHSIVHRYQTKSDSPDDIVRRTREHPPATHPLVIHHPVTGQKCLYVSEGYTSTIDGLPEAEAQALLGDLCVHSTRAEFQYRHHWAVGDLLIWDNRSTLHRATFDYTPSERRLMRRATVAGEALA